MIAMILALQEVSSEILPVEILQIRFDLADAPDAIDTSGVIVVRGRALDVRLPELPDAFTDHPPRAATSIFGNGDLALRFSPTVLPNGVVSNRAMVTLKIAF